MRRRFVAFAGWALVALPVAGLASSDDGTPACAIYSLEGVGVGMPAEKALAAIQDARWKYSREYHGDREGYGTLTRRDGRPVRISMLIARGAVDELLVDYLPDTVKSGMLEGVSAKYDDAAASYQVGVEEELTARLGTPQWKGDLESFEGDVPRAAWIDTTCDRVVLLRSGKRGKLLEPVMDVRLARASTWQAALDARVAPAFPTAGSNPASPAGARASSSDCSTRSLFGLHLGMSIGDAQALTRGAKWLRASEPIDGRIQCEVNHWSTCPLPRARFILWFSGDVLDEIDVLCPPKSVEQRASQLGALEREGMERFGAPTSRPAGASPDGVVREEWNDVACDSDLTVKHGVTDSWSGPSVVLGATLRHAAK